MLREVTIENFKSLHQARVELKPLTIIIGPNASGKSNFLEGLEALQRLVQYKGTTRPGREGDRPVISIHDLLWRKAPPDEAITWGLNVELQPTYYPRQL